MAGFVQGEGPIVGAIWGSLIIGIGFLVGWAGMVVYSRMSRALVPIYLEAIDGSIGAALTILRSSAGGRKMLEDGVGMLRIADKLNIGSGTVQRIAREMTRNSPAVSVMSRASQGMVTTL